MDTKIDEEFKPAVNPLPASDTKSEQVNISETEPDAAIEPTQEAIDGNHRKASTGPTEILGQVSWLMMQSPLHKHFFYADAEWLIMPPLMIKQFRVFQKDGRPVAYASWANLTEEVEERISKGTIRLKPADWNAGDRKWLIDLIAPFGGAEEILKQLRAQVFKGEKIKSLQPAPDGNGMAVVEW